MAQLAEGSEGQRCERQVRRNAEARAIVLRECFSSIAEPMSVCLK